ncbi:glutamate--cysteine ligase [Faunimonas pinastri]|uniref:Glutamate--cysteine ligase n=1 Tax=Faunimonas pinastri TaxID=1855383 RepID=A0A1H8ZHT8_9HYPH|nr:glutamate--cysteine ligase [Faunimonas pinastri]SEP63885.1 glutamate--cysteine ligase [Faunimonas pinastri]
MARDTADHTLIENRDQLAAYLESGSKPEAEWRIGTEHEKIVFYRDGNRPVPYEGTAGIRALLEGMQALTGWEPIHDEGAIIGLADAAGGGAISLEPGGQFELSGAPLSSLHQTRDELAGHLAQVKQVAEPLGIDFLALGFSPKWTRAETPVMPKSRYRIMTNHMPRVGSLGLDMMYRTCTVQVNLDFKSEADMRDKLRASLALQPIATALFANSPFTDGRPNGFQTFRGEIWKDTDTARTGGLLCAFGDDFGFERYTDWALDVPMYFVVRDGRYHDMTSVTFRQFLEGGAPDTLRDKTPTMGDWKNHLSTLFPDVRLKTFLEMRGADCGSPEMIVALSALWVGLLYDCAALDGALQLVSGWSAEDRLLLRNDVPKAALALPFRGGAVRDVAREMVELAKGGLQRRAVVANGEDETTFLAPLEEILSSDRTDSDRLLGRFSGAWGGSIEPVFTENTY